MSNLLPPKNRNTVTKLLTHGRVIPSPTCMYTPYELSYSDSRLTLWLY